jgi:hypothetical protein
MSPFRKSISRIIPAGFLHERKANKGHNPSDAGTEKSHFNIFKWKYSLPEILLAGALVQ